MKKSQQIIQMIKDAGPDGIRVRDLCKATGIKLSDISGYLVACNKAPIAEDTVYKTVFKNGRKRRTKDWRLFYCDADFYRSQSGKEWRKQ